MRVEETAHKERRVQGEDCIGLQKQCIFCEIYRDFFKLSLL